MRHFGFLFAALLLPFAGCTGDSVTGVSGDEPSPTPTRMQVTAKSEIKMVPLEGYLTGTSWLDLSRPGCPTGSLPLAGQGSGEASHVGEFTMSAEYCSFSLVDPTNPAYLGTVRIVAANGDEVYTEFTGYSTSLTEYTQTETIVGGTGRFENITGTIVAHGTRGALGFEATFVGECSSVGSTE